MCFWQQFFVLPIEVKSVYDLFVDFGKDYFDTHSQVMTLNQVFAYWKNFQQ